MSQQHSMHQNEKSPKIHPAKIGRSHLGEGEDLQNQKRSRGGTKADTKKTKLDEHDEAGFSDKKEGIEFMVLADGERVDEQKSGDQRSFKNSSGDAERKSDEAATRSQMKKDK